LRRNNQRTKLGNSVVSQVFYSHLLNWNSMKDYDELGYDELDLPLLTEKDEEFQMLLEVADEYQRRKDKTAEQKSGKATEIIIRKYLLGKGLNVALNHELTIQGTNQRADLIDSILLRPSIDPNKPVYQPQEVDTVIEIKNNAVGDQSTGIREKFDKIEPISKNLRFAVIILSERKRYTHEITDKKLANKNYHSFTLVSRKQYPKGGLYLRSSVMEMLRKREMKKTFQWEKLIEYLKGK